MKTGDTIFYASVALICGAISYIFLKKTIAPPDLRVTRRMIREAELGCYMGNDYDLEDEDDDDEYVDL